MHKIYVKKKLCAIDNESKKYVEKINNKKTFLRKSFESMEKITFFKGAHCKTQTPIQRKFSGKPGKTNSLE